MKKFISIVSTGTITTFVPLIAAAQEGLKGDTVFRAGGQEIPNKNVAGLTNIAGIGKTIADWIFTALLIVAVIMIVVAAFRYLFSGGDEGKIKDANRSLLYAAVAIAVGLLAQAIVFIVAQLTGANTI